MLPFPSQVHAGTRAVLLADLLFLVVSIKDVVFHLNNVDRSMRWFSVYIFILLSDKSIRIRDLTFQMPVYVVYFPLRDDLQP